MAIKQDPMLPPPVYNKNKGGNGGGNNNGGNSAGKPQFDRIAAFQPGQRGLLADQLSTGFGGSQDQWGGLLSKWYDPMKMQAPFKYGGDPSGIAGGKPAKPLTADDMAIADMWIQRGGQSAVGNPHVFGVWSSLDPKIQQYVTSELEARNARGGR